MDSTFLSFYRSIETSQKQNSKFLFFKKEGYYSCHGYQASKIAVEFYRTESVLRRENGGLETLHLSKTLFSKIISKLLIANYSVSIWSKEGSTWKECCKASPGNIRELEIELGTFLCNEVSSSAFIAAITASEIGGLMRVGFAVISTTLGVIELLEFSDSLDFMK
jgi:DNA mismatch repair ATPase MutS